MTDLTGIYPAPYNVLADVPQTVMKPWQSYAKVQEAIKKYFVTGSFAKDFVNIILPMIKDNNLDWTKVINSALGFASALPFIGPAFSALSPFINMLFPSNQQDVFNQILTQVQQLVDQKIAKTELNRIEKSIEGLADLLLPAHNPSITSLAEMNKDGSNATAVDGQFDSIEKIFISQIPGLISTTQYINLTLPLYVQGVTLYILFLKSINDNADLLFPPNQINPTDPKPEFFKNKYKKALIGAIELYTSKTKEYYTTYISYAQKHIDPSKEKTDAEYIPKFATVKNMLRYSCLDAVALWPLANIRDYPIQANVTPTRLLYSKTSGGKGTINPPDGFMPWELRSINVRNWDRIDYLNQTGADGKSFPLGSFSGAAKPVVNSTRDNPMTAAYTDWSGTWANGQYQGIHFTMADGTTVDYNGPSANPYMDVIEAPADHKLHYIAAGTYDMDGTCVGGLINTFIPMELFPENIIGDLDPDNQMKQIKGFPLEKCTNLRNISKTPELINGTNNSYVFGPSSQVILPITNVTWQIYRIRYRAATKGAQSRLTFKIDGILDQTVSLPDTSSLTDIITMSDKDANAATSPVIAGDFGNYVLVTDSKYLPNMIDLPAGNYNLSITSSSSEEFALDRIEFVPLDSIQQSIPQTTTIANTFQTIWSSSIAYAKSISLTGNVNNAASITFQLFNSDKLVKEFPVIGNGPTNSHFFHGSSTDCSDRAYPFSFPNEAIPDKFNKVIVKINSGSTSTCNTGDVFTNSYNADIDIQPDTPSQSFEELEDLEKITKQVNMLFASSSYTKLAPTVTDYWIDQVALKVNALSDGVFGIEKKALRKLVNKAKQLSKALNILVGANFEKLDKWLLGLKATVVDDSELFKGKHLFLQPANGLFSSYAYQKVDESKLQQNTRYTVSGFIAQSNHLELVVSRYGKEIKTILNVPYGEAFPISSDTNPNCCKPGPCQCLSCDGSQPDSHFFNYSIDVGQLYPDLNPGIEFGLRIVQPNGMAKVSNLEIREERSLTEKEIKKLQRKEQKWKKAWDKERAEISAILQPIVNQINTFYKNEDWNSDILPHVTYQDLYNVVLPALPKVRHWFMEDREGEHYGILQRLKQAVERVFTQLEEQNLIHNGSFTNGLINWLVEGDAQMTTLENGNLALRLSHWDASVSQSIDISDFDEDKEYKLRVRGKGKGTITIQHGEEMKTMSFDKDSFYFQEQPFYFEEPSFYLQIQSEANEFIVDSIEIIEILEEDE